MQGLPEDQPRAPIVGNWKVVALSRLGLAIVLIAYTLSYATGQGRDDPRWLLIAAVASLGTMIGLSFYQLQGRAIDARLVIAIDIVCVLVFWGGHLLDARRLLFPLTFAPLVEAAIVFGFSGAVIAWIALAAGDLARETLSTTMLEVSFQPETQLVRLGVGLVTALALGALATAAEERRVSERLRAVDDMKNTFLHAVSHELRTPLASVKGFADILRRHGKDFTQEKIQEVAESISVNADKLQRLLADLLDLDRLTRNVLQPTLTVTDVGKLVLNVVEQADVTRHVLHVEAPPLVAEVDGSKLERILENLISNAAKHTPPHTHIYVSVVPQDEGFVIRVEDEGPGVPETMRKQVFEPFRQGPGEDEFRPAGTGIGLSLVARFAELHGGRAWVEDRNGTPGASFCVFLPVRILPPELPEVRPGARAAPG